MVLHLLWIIPYTVFCLFVGVCSVLFLLNGAEVTRTQRTLPRES